MRVLIAVTAATCLPEPEPAPIGCSPTGARACEHDYCADGQITIEWQTATCETAHGCIYGDGTPTPEDPVSAARRRPLRFDGPLWIPGEVRADGSFETFDGVIVRNEEEP